MAVTVELAYTLEVKSGDTFIGTITDETADYGGANPARLDGAFYITGNKLAADGTVSEALVFDSYDPATDTEYTFTIPEDGWHQFLGVFLPDYDNVSGVYAQYEAVYGPDGVAYKSIWPTPISAI